MVIQYNEARARENFPVASWLLPIKARHTILAYYDFARGADNIADDALLDAEEKCAQLQVLRDALSDPALEVPDWALRFCLIARADASYRIYGEELLVAFLQDATKQRYATMEELKLYCRYSAAPVGRLVLQACGEQITDTIPSDALCGALQLLNHLQDMREDYLCLDRIYLPQDVMKQHGMEEAQLAYDSFMREEAQAVADAVLDQVDTWLAQSRELMGKIKTTRLRLEITFIWQIARRLSRKMRKRDLFLERVTCSRFDYAFCAMRSIKALWQS